MDKGLAKNFFCLFFLILILGIGGFFLWKNSQKTLLEKLIDAKFSLAEDFIIKETPEGKMVENKKAGISYKIPNDWIVKEDMASFYSPDAKFNEKRNDIIENGCRIYIFVSYVKTNLYAVEGLRKENVAALSQVISNEEFKRTEIKNFPALVYGFDVEGLKESYNWIDIPFKNRLYGMLLVSSIQEEERCRIEFDKFLESIVISPR